MDKESDTHRDSSEHTKLRRGHKKRKLVSILFHMALQLDRGNGPLKLYVAALRAAVTRLEMRSEIEGIFLFVIVTVVLMEFSDCSAMKRHGFVTRKTELSHRSRDDPAVNFLEERKTSSSQRSTIRLSFFTAVRSLVTSVTFVPSNSAWI